MFDTNSFKRSVKAWINTHPKAPVEELADYCESLVPQESLLTHEWLVEQTLSWYSYILKHSESTYNHRDDDAWA